MDFGELATRWTVRIALAFYVVALIVRLNARTRAARILWTFGFVAFAIHVACAFHFFHHWSHDAAYADTAQKTAAATGLVWGGGLYLNYFFAFVWGADAGWWWGNAVSYAARSRLIEWGVQSFLAFMSFNATVVFGHGAMRWAGAIATIVLLTALADAARRRYGSPGSESKS
jgi:hypothetical protein